MLVTQVSFITGDVQHSFRRWRVRFGSLWLAVHHFTEPRRVVTEMGRVCRPGGRFYWKILLPVSIPLAQLISIRSKSCATPPMFELCL